jgi:hypothetical protein
MKTAPPQKALTHWPPFRYSIRHKVATGDSWVGLATKFRRQDPWDIIQFNFETKVPEIVNYYMAQLIGSTTSKDGKNYSFSSGDQPGYVYIPPVEWKPAMGPYTTDLWKARVLETLDNWAVDQVPHLNRAGIVDIVTNKIQVEEYSTLWVPYEYDNRDGLYCHRLAQDFTDMAWLIKEAVHIWNGPYGWNDGGYLKNEVNGWVALAAWWDLMLPGLRDLFYFLDATEGHLQKMSTFKAAREYWEVAKLGKIPLPSTVAIENAVRRDPSFIRRMHVFQERAS